VTVGDSLPHSAERYCRVSGKKKLEKLRHGGKEKVGADGDNKGKGLNKLRIHRYGEIA
jgi:hypothetical protein